MIKTAKDLGLLIRQRRKEMGLSQADLAGICRVGNRFLDTILYKIKDF